MSSTNNVTVVGAGVVGLSSAYLLAKDGAQVTVVDSGEPRFGTSMANAGWISPSHVIPFAAPGMVSMGTKELLKRTGSFGFNLGAGPQLATWTAKFIASCTQQHVDYCVPALRELIDVSMDELDHLVNDHGLARTHQPLWYLFSSDEAAHHAEVEIDTMTKYGIPVQEVALDTARAAEPIIKDSVKAVVELTGDYGVDPAELVNLLHSLCARHGVTFKTGTVTALNARTQGVDVTTATDAWTSDYLVLAAGAWSRELAKMVGANLNVIAAKGHSVTIPGLANQPQRTLMLAEQRIATNALASGLRMSTGYALTTPHDRSINDSAIDKLVLTASHVLDLPTELGDIDPWTGVRPSSPDGMPYIGALTNAPRVITATGHGMLGTMMALGTGRLVADLVAGNATSRESLKFSPARP